MNRLPFKIERQIFTPAERLAWLLLDALDVEAVELPAPEPAQVGELRAVLESQAIRRGDRAAALGLERELRGLVEGER